jgi:hypothetical protein
MVVCEFYELDCGRGRGCNGGLGLVWVCIGCLVLSIL